MLQGNFVKIFNSTQTFKNFFVLTFELILVFGSNNVLTEGARKVYRGRQDARKAYRGRRVGQGLCTQMAVGCQPYLPAVFYPQKEHLVLISVRG
jgi:hypothetical protein